MNAQEKLLEYAKKNNSGTVYTDEQFCGKMATEGIVISRTSMTKTIARMSREGRTITVTETLVTEDTFDPNNTTEHTTEVMRMEI